MNSWYHAEASARKWGGRPEEYIDIHEFIDSSKRIIGDVRHRSMYHHTEGIFLCQRIFGRTITVGKIPAGGLLCIPEELEIDFDGVDTPGTDTEDPFVAELLEVMSRPITNHNPQPVTILRGPMPTYRPREVPVRLIAELHVEQDLGWIPSPKDYIDGMVLKPWMGGPVRKERNLREVFPKPEIFGEDDYVD